jgi:hypothetical protein
MRSVSIRFFAVGLLSLSLLIACAEQGSTDDEAADTVVTPPSVPTTASGDAPIDPEDPEAGMNTRRPDSMDDVKPEEGPPGTERGIP